MILGSATGIAVEAGCVDTHVIDVERTEFAVANTCVEQADADMPLASYVLPSERGAGPTARPGLD